MKYLAVLLLLGVWVRHQTSYPFSQMTGITQPGVFYIQGGLWEATLCAVLAGIFWYQTKGLYRAVLVSAMAVGIIEALQMSVCRSLIKNMSDVPKGVNICDYLSGLPIGATVTGTAFIVTVFFIAREFKK